jgi:hypothetical protein
MSEERKIGLDIPNTFMIGWMNKLSVTWTKNKYFHERLACLCNG